MRRSPDRARQVTGEDEMEDVEGAATEEGEMFAILDGKAADEEDEGTEEGFAIVVVKVEKWSGVAAQADAR